MGFYMPSKKRLVDSDSPILDRLTFGDGGVACQLFGPNNANLQCLERISGVSISGTGTEVSLQGQSQPVKQLRLLLGELYHLAEKGRALKCSDVEQAYRIKQENSQLALSDVLMDTILTSHQRKQISPKGIGQKNYIEAIRNYDVVFGIGPAGTGKTYLAMAAAVAALKSQSVQRIVITRPAVEAGEKLGFLPGDLVEKVNPYLRPLYDALHDMFDVEKVSRLMEQGTIEVAPLAFMRGRTLNDSFIILDEAQNTTSEQMKMFLTRLGYGSQAVITGDITQVDLPRAQSSGLIEAKNILSGVDGIAVCVLSDIDVVRHPLVRNVIRAYDLHENGKTQNRPTHFDTQKNENRINQSPEKSDSPPVKTKTTTETGTHLYQKPRETTLTRPTDFDYGGSNQTSSPRSDHSIEKTVKNSRLPGKKKQSAKKQSAKKQSAKKQSAKKQSPKKQSPKKQGPKKQSPRKARSKKTK